MQITPEFRRERCVRYRYSYSACSRCREACPHEAITLSGEGATVAPASCQNCALCVAACPTEAWSAENLPHIELLKQATNGSHFTFACAPSQADGDARVPCLGALDATLLAYLANRGISVELKGSWHCGKCPHGAKGEAMREFAQEGLECLRSGIGNEKWSPVVLTEPEVAEKTPQINASRRQLFRRFAGRAVAEVARLDEPVQPAPAPLKAVRVAAPFSTVRRELVQSIWPAGGVGELPFTVALPLAALNLSPGCNACEACARVCPTGALAVRESQVSWELAFQFNRCVACGVCLEACQPGVLDFATTVPLVPLVIGQNAVPLHTLDKRRCIRCDRFFITSGAETLCPVCGGDDQDFASIFG